MERAGNEIGADRINEARAALEKGDYSIADDIFAEIEAREQMAVENAARAAYGRGEVAKAEVRWADAARHFARSASLKMTLENLYYAAHFAKLSGDYATALRFADEMEAKARETDDLEKLSLALDRQAATLKDLGRYKEAEPLFREALDIDERLSGRESHNYAAALNNLAEVIRLQGRFVDAEDLYRQALEVARETIGDGHRNYASGLNNLGSVVEAQGRYAEAERLYREALEISGKTVGERHPEYAIRLVNLGSLLGHNGKVSEGREMLEQALATFADSLPTNHPYISTTVGHIENLPDAD